MKPIYLDYASTTPVDPRVVEKMQDCLTFEGDFGNAGSRSHSFGWKAEELVEEARLNVANLVTCDPREIIFTSGATESDNLAIKGAAYFYKNKGKHIVTSKIEHKAVLDTCRQLENEGFEVAILDDGLQDYKINTNQKIVCFNSNQLVGNGLVLPAGPLRETLYALKNADIVLINGDKVQNFENKILSINKRIEISINENLDKEFIKNLTSKLYEWTLNRWLIAISKSEGLPSIKQKKLLS